MVVIKAQDHRSLPLNRAEALARLQALVDDAAHVPSARHATKPTRASKQRRLAGKAHRGADQGRARQRRVSSQTAAATLSYGTDRDLPRSIPQRCARQLPQPPSTSLPGRLARCGRPMVEHGAFGGAFAMPGRRRSAAGHAL